MAEREVWWEDKAGERVAAQSGKQWKLLSGPNQTEQVIQGAEDDQTSCFVHLQTHVEDSDI